MKLGTLSKAPRIGALDNVTTLQKHKLMTDTPAPGHYNHQSKFTSLSVDQQQKMKSFKFPADRSASMSSIDEDSYSTNSPQPNNGGGGLSRVLSKASLGSERGLLVNKNSFQTLKQSPGPGDYDLSSKQLNGIKRSNSISMASMQKPHYQALNQTAEEIVQEYNRILPKTIDNYNYRNESPIQQKKQRIQAGDRWYSELKQRNPYGNLAPVRHADIEGDPGSKNLHYDESHLQRKPTIKLQGRQRGGEFAHFAERNPYGDLKPKKDVGEEPAPNYYANKLWNQNSKIPDESVGLVKNSGSYSKAKIKHFGSAERAFHAKDAEDRSRQIPGPQSYNAKGSNYPDLSGKGGALCLAGTGNTSFPILQRKTSMQAIAEEELKKPGPGDYTSKRMFDEHKIKNLFFAF